MKLKSLMLLMLALSFFSSWSQQSPIRDIHITMESVQPFIPAMDSGMVNIPNQRADSLFRDHFQQHDFNVSLSILMHHTDSISGFHIEVGRSENSSEIANIDITYDDAPTYNYRRKNNFITIDLGQFNNLVNVSARVYAISSNGTTSPVKSMVINNYGNEN